VYEGRSLKNENKIEKIEDKEGGKIKWQILWQLSTIEKCTASALSGKC
jgi:hypothetical protein